MECNTVRADTAYKECPFMGRRGCTFKGGTCLPVVKECEGCNRAVSIGAEKYCLTFADPADKWKKSVCSFATHITRQKAVEQVKKLNPLKAAKRVSRGG